jgi:hypothetical protein
MADKWTTAEGDAAEREVFRRRDETPGYLPYRVLCTDLQCEVTALREALENLLNSDNPVEDTEWDAAARARTTARELLTRIK